MNQVAVAVLELTCKCREGPSCLNLQSCVFVVPDVAC